MKKTLATLTSDQLVTATGGLGSDSVTHHNPSLVNKFGPDPIYRPSHPGRPALPPAPSPTIPTNPRSVLY